MGRNAKTEPMDRTSIYMTAALTQRIRRFAATHHRGNFSRAMAELAERGLASQSSSRKTTKGAA